MLYLTLLISLLVTVNAFVTRTNIKQSKTLRMGFENEVGAQPPLGFFDPLGLLKDADQERFDRLRYVELKHGRIAMLAVLGHIDTTAGHRCPGDIAFNLPYADMKTGLAAFDTIPGWGIAQIILFIGVLEAGFGYQEKKIAEECQMRMDEWGWSKDKQRSKFAIELNNGRAAQMGILGLMVHEKLNGNPYVLNSLFGAPVAFNQ